MSAGYVTVRLLGVLDIPCDGGPPISYRGVLRGELALGIADTWARRQAAVGRTFVRADRKHVSALRTGLPAVRRFGLESWLGALSDGRAGDDLVTLGR